MIVVLKLVVESGNACCAETCLGKGGGIGCAAERGNHTLCAVNAKLLCRFHEQVGNIFVRRNGCVKVAVVYHEILRVVNGVV